MRHLEGENRQQASLLPESLEDFVGSDHPVRVIDAYIDTLDIRALGFDKAVTKNTGRKPYHPADLLKLHVYGYLNKVTTSRRLETECHRNLEVLWLMKRLRPDFKTIADFRKDNGKAIRGACRAFIQFCREAELLGGALGAIDGSKFKAAASIDQALTRKQLERNRAAIERKIERYLAQLDEADRVEGSVELERDHVGQALEKLKAKSQELQDREAVMDWTQSDSRQLLPMSEQTKAVLGVDKLEMLADMGYSNGMHLDACERQDITATVPRPTIPSSYPEFYQKQDFDYDAQRDESLATITSLLCSAHSHAYEPIRR